MLSQAQRAAAGARALYLGKTEFLTFDANQQRLAETVGLIVAV